MVFEHEKDYYFFKPQAFRDFLKTKRFAKAYLILNSIKCLKSLKVTTAKLKVNNNPEHCWKIATTILESDFRLKVRKTLVKRRLTNA